MDGAEGAIVDPAVVLPSPTPTDCASLSDDEGTGGSEVTVDRFCASFDCSLFTSEILFN